MTLSSNKVSCATCRFWQDDTDKLFGTKRCAKAVQMWDASEWRDAGNGCVRVLLPEYATQKMFVKDGSDYRADLYTAADFFCAHYEAPLSAQERDDGR